jgi:predicted metallo-beta-lactamase superfamily hydrolase
MNKYKSTLADVIQEVYQCKDVDKAKQILLGHLLESKIDKVDKRKMELDIQSLTHINAVYKYATNAMFRFEGLSVNSYKEKQ